MSFKYYNEQTRQYEVLTIPAIKGERGEQGIQGETGVTPNLQIGTVTTLEPGGQASATIRGPKENPTLDIAIPRGGKGEKGIFVGSKEDAPLSAEIVIDHSDEGSFIGESIKEELVEVPIIDGVLTLTTDKYQTTTIENNTMIVLPNVDKFTEIHLFFSATSSLTLSFPIIAWQTEPNIELGKTYEFIFTYTTEWLGGSVSYNTPLKTPIMNGLVCWLEAKDLVVDSNNMIANNTTWKNKVKGGSNAIIKTISGNEVQGKDGDYFRTNRNAYVVLPSFATKDANGISVYVDGKINQSPNEQYSKAFLLSYGGHYTQQVSLTCGVSEFGHIRNFGEKPSTSLVGDINTVYPIPMKVGVSVGGNAFSPGYGVAKNYQNNTVINFLSVQRYNHEFTTNFLSAETPTTQNKGDFSYGLVLIYNRALTEEEMQHNYEYSLAIQRG